MRIQPISQNIVCKSKKKDKTDKFEELSKLGVIFAASGGLILPQNATAETVKKFEQIIKKDFPDYKICNLGLFVKKLKK